MRYRVDRTLTVLLLVLALLVSLAGVAEDQEETDVPITVPEEAFPEELEEFDLLTPEYAEDADTLPVAVEALPVEDEPESTPEDEDLDIPKASASTELTLGVLDSYALKTGSLGKKITFKSSQPKVASVDKKGIIRARKKGIATITCYSGKKKVASYSVMVVAAPKKVDLGAKSITLGVKETFILDPSLPKNTAASFTYTVKNKKVASVSAEGVIKGLKTGKTTVTVTTHNDVTAKLTVTVKEAPKKLSLNKTKETLEVGKTLKLKAKLSKDTASKITWKSSDTSVATVNDAGKVTAVGLGKAKITATTFNGRKASCAVTVKWTGKKTGDFLIAKGVVIGYTGPGGDIAIPSRDASGNKVVAIGPSAFAGDGMITSVTIPSGVKRIGDSAFEGCASLTKVIYPNSIEEFGVGVFRNCLELEDLQLSD